MIISLLVFAVILIIGILLIRAVIDMIPFPNPPLRQAVFFICIIILVIVGLQVSHLANLTGVLP